MEDKTVAGSGASAVQRPSPQRIHLKKLVRISEEVHVTPAAELASKKAAIRVQKQKFENAKRVGNFIGASNVAKFTMSAPVAVLHRSVSPPTAFGGPLSLTEGLRSHRKPSSVSPGGGSPPSRSPVRSPTHARGGGGSRPKTAGAALPSNTPLDNLSLDDRALVGAWVRDAEQQDRQYRSASLRLEMRLQQAKNFTSLADKPCKLETAVACACLDQLCGLFGQYEELAQGVRNALYQAIFTFDPAPLAGEEPGYSAAAEQDYYARAMYFSDPRPLPHEVRVEKAAALLKGMKIDELLGFLEPITSGLSPADKAHVDGMLGLQHAEDALAPERFLKMSEDDKMTIMGRMLHTFPVEERVAMMTSLLRNMDEGDRDLLMQLQALGEAEQTLLKAILTEMSIADQKRLVHLLSYLALEEKIECLQLLHALDMETKQQLLSTWLRFPESEQRGLLTPEIASALMTMNDTLDQSPFLSFFFLIEELDQHLRIKLIHQLVKLEGEAAQGFLALLHFYEHDDKEICLNVVEQLVPEDFVELCQALQSHTVKDQLSILYALQGLDSTDMVEVLGLYAQLVAQTKIVMAQSLASLKLPLRRRVLTLSRSFPQRERLFLLSAINDTEPEDKEQLILWFSALESPVAAALATALDGLDHAQRITLYDAIVAIPVLADQSAVLALLGSMGAQEKLEAVSVLALLEDKGGLLVPLVDSLGPARRRAWGVLKSLTGPQCLIAVESMSELKVAQRSMLFDTLTHMLEEDKYILLAVLEEMEPPAATALMALLSSLAGMEQSETLQLLKTLNTFTRPFLVEALDSLPSEAKQWFLHMLERIPDWQRTQLLFVLKGMTPEERVEFELLSEMSPETQATIIIAMQEMELELRTQMMPMLRAMTAELQSEYIHLHIGLSPVATIQLFKCALQLPPERLQALFAVLQRRTPDERIELLCGLDGVDPGLVMDLLDRHTEPSDLINAMFVALASLDSGADRALFLQLGLRLSQADLATLLHAMALLEADEVSGLLQQITEMPEEQMLSTVASMNAMTGDELRQVMFTLSSDDNSSNNVSLSAAGKIFDSVLEVYVVQSRDYLSHMEAVVEQLMSSDLKDLSEFAHYAMPDASESVGTIIGHADSVMNGVEDQAAMRMRVPHSGEVADTVDERRAAFTMDVLRHWGSYLLHKIGDRDSSLPEHLCKPLKNIHAALGGGEEWAVLLYAIAMDELSGNAREALKQLKDSALDAVDPEVRGQLMTEAVETWLHLPHDMLQTAELTAGNVDWNFALLCYLYVLKPGLSTPTAHLKQLSHLLGDLSESFAAVDELRQTGQRVSVRRLQDLGKRMAFVGKEVRAFTLAINSGHQQWWGSAKVVIATCLEDLCRRARGRPSSVALSAERDQQDAFADVHPSRLEDLIEDPVTRASEVTTCLNLIKEHYHDIHSIYNAYSALSSTTGALTVTLAAFRKLVQDIQLSNSPQFNPMMIQIIYVKCTFTKGENGGEASTERDLTPPCFVEGLLRLAHARYNDKDKKKSSKALSLSERVRKFISAHLLPHATMVDSDTLRQQMGSDAMRIVVEKNKIMLAKAFSKYASFDTRSTTDKSLTVREYLKLMTDHQIIGEGFSNKVAMTIFQNAQLHETTDEITYNELIEALTACAHIKNPDPYLPLAQRLAQFLRQHFDPVSGGPPVRRRTSVSISSAGADGMSGGRRSSITGRRSSITGRRGSVTNSNTPGTRSRRASVTRRGSTSRRRRSSAIGPAGPSGEEEIDPIVAAAAAAVAAHEAALKAGTIKPQENSDSESDDDEELGTLEEHPPTPLIRVRTPGSSPRDAPL